MRWERLHQHGDDPGERSSHSLTFIDGNLLLFGGEHEARIPVNNDVYAYDLGSQRWIKLQTTGNAPSPRLAHSAVDVGGQLWIFGGRSGKGNLNRGIHITLPYV